MARRVGHDHGDHNRVYARSRGEPVSSLTDQALRDYLIRESARTEPAPDEEWLDAAPGHTWHDGVVGDSQGQRSRDGLRQGRERALKAVKFPHVKQVFLVERGSCPVLVLDEAHLLTATSWNLCGCGASRPARLVGMVRKAVNNQLWDTLYGLRSTGQRAVRRDDSVDPVVLAAVSPGATAPQAWEGAGLFRLGVLSRSLPTEVIGSLRRTGRCGLIGVAGCHGLHVESARRT
jgi:hypothetical protein